MSEGLERWREWVHGQRWSRTDWPIEFWPYPDTTMGWFLTELRNQQTAVIEIGQPAVVAMENESEWGLDARRDIKR